MTDATEVKTESALLELAELAERPYFTFVRDALHQDGVTMNREPGSTFFKNNFDLCRALNMTSMGIVLERMVKEGWLDKREAELFHLQASSLLAQLRTANNRAHAARASLPPSTETRGEK